MSDTGDMVRKIQGLLAKAESTDSEHEAEALMAAAQRLMTKHAIDQTMLRAQSGKTSKVVTECVQASTKTWHNQDSALMTGIAQANHCQVWSRTYNSKRKGDIFVVGFEEDVANVLTIFASLQIQQARFLKHVHSPDWEISDQSWRRGWREGFAVGIRDRLVAAMDEVEAEGDAEYHGSLLPALIDKDAEVSEAMPAGLGKARRRRAWAGAINQGVSDARRADVGSARLGTNAAIGA